MFGFVKQVNFKMLIVENTVVVSGYSEGTVAGELKTFFKDLSHLDEVVLREGFAFGPKSIEAKRAEIGVPR